MNLFVKEPEKWYHQRNVSCDFPLFFIQLNVYEEEGHDISAMLEGEDKRIYKSMQIFRSSDVRFGPTYHSGRFYNPETCNVVGIYTKFVSPQTRNNKRLNEVSNLL